jgi:hypothetical protein
MEIGINTDDSRQFDFRSYLTRVENVSMNENGVVIDNRSGVPCNYSCLVKNGIFYRIEN